METEAIYCNILGESNGSDFFIDNTRRDYWKLKLYDVTNLRWKYRIEVTSTLIKQRAIDGHWSYILLLFLDLDPIYTYY